jgi:hypothetical protein
MKTKSHSKPLTLRCNFGFNIYGCRQKGMKRERKRANYYFFSSREGGKRKGCPYLATFSMKRGKRSQ